MSTDPNNRFVIQESPTELEWLRLIGPLLTEGGLFSEYTHLPSDITSILDIGCGPGDWVLSVAETYPDVKVTGIDVSKIALEDICPQCGRGNRSRVRQSLSAIPGRVFAESFSGLEIYLTVWGKTPVAPL